MGTSWPIGTTIEDDTEFDDELASAGGDGFTNEDSRGSDLAHVLHHRQARRIMLRGGFWGIGGLLVTLLSFSPGSVGATYLLAWSVVILGTLQFFRGLAEI